MEALTLSNKHVLVVGLGASGRSAVCFLLAYGARVHGVDRNANTLQADPEIQKYMLQGLSIGSDDYLDVRVFDLVVVSPGIPSQHILLQCAKDAKLPIMGEIELGCYFAKNRMIGVTGTNGKTTVTLMIAHILNHSGKRSHALGNIGIPFTKHLLSIPTDDIVVLELSSYQIETLTRQCLDAAIILNITPDHLDRYQSMEDYIKAKIAIVNALKPSKPIYIEEQTWQLCRTFCENVQPLLYGYNTSSFLWTDLIHIIQDGKKKCFLPRTLSNRKSHDLENFLAAYSICSLFGVTDSQFLEGVETFCKPPHRIQFIVEHQGISFYDDSKGTNVDAVVRAIESMQGPVILIAGGVDKGFSYAIWSEKCKNKLKTICAIGQAADKIREQLSTDFPVFLFDSLEKAVERAVQLATKGDNVLLSPGCSSFDMFRDYAHRGREFQRFVHEQCKRLSTVSKEAK